MTSRIAASEVARHLTARHLTARHHTNSTTGTEWRPGFRAVQASPRTVRIWHDGPDEVQFLDQYGTALQAVGYTVTQERAKGQRPSMHVTHP